MTKKLTALEFERLERARLLTEFRGKELALIDSRTKLCEARQKILELTIANLEIERRNIAEDKEKIVLSKASDAKTHEETLKQIKRRLKIKGKFGYKPDTLEIVEDDSK